MIGATSVRSPSTAASSKVIDKVGAAVLRLERKSEPRHWQLELHGDLCRTPPTASTTPRSPRFGRWSGGINANAATSQGSASPSCLRLGAGASNVDFTIGQTGFNSVPDLAVQGPRPVLKSG